ncbi:Fic family protein [uncultured Litoreibacter sp.]|uniref:Fic family protein n=1 Tax=uncultured Litoreibacter sp. TaxID=1392394 RepID=UPI0026059681|nr:Fic family protein [uncultured Litoreibacter sp.]
MAEIWSSPYWPRFIFDATALAPLLAAASEAVGEVRGMHAGLTDDERDEIILREFTREAVHSFSIEGVELEPSQIQASIVASMANKALTQPKRRADDVVAVMRDARSGAGGLTAERLQNWHATLFAKAEVEDLGQWRSFDMVIAKSNIAGRENEVLYRAVPAARVAYEMEEFLNWLATDKSPPAIRAAVAHLWFESIHPFSDGNGRIGRALIEYVFAQTALLPFSLSRQIEADKQGYYDALQAGRVEGQGGIDATPFIGWFLEALLAGVEAAHAEARFLAARNRFFLRHESALSARQGAVLRKWWGLGAESVSEGLTARLYVKLGSIAPATATRDLAALEEAGVLEGVGAGRSRVYLSI